MLKLNEIIFSILLLFFSSHSIAQIKNDDCENIKINDTLTVKVGDYVLDKKIKIDITKIFLDSTNIKNITAINPCSHIHSGYRGAYNIERKIHFPLISVSELIEKYKKENPDFLFYKVVINKELLEDYKDYRIEVTKDLKITIIQDKIRENTLTILIKQYK